MDHLAVDALTGASGSLVGLVLGLVGGGGSILAVPLLVYVVGIKSAHVAIGTSAIAVAVSALANLLMHARAGNVKWRCALVFTVAGALGAVGGSMIAKMIDGQKLLVLFGVLMLVVGIMMLRRGAGDGDPAVTLCRENARRLLPRLTAGGFGVGSLSGFFGIGGGFLIVPGLMLSTGMPIGYAIGSSLVSVTGFGMTTASSYAVSGLVDWRVAALFVSGGILGGLAGTTLGRRLARQKRTLGFIFAGVVIVVGVYVVARALPPLLAA